MKSELHPHQLEILRVLRREGTPIPRPELYAQLSFSNWLGKWLGTPRSPGRYPNSLLERGLVHVEDESGSEDENGHRCLFFGITKKGIQALKGSVPAKDELEAMSRSTLRELAKQHGISTTGTKKDVIGRFMASR